MLLNEFLKEHKRVQEQRARVAQLEATVARQDEDFRSAMAQQQKSIDGLTTRLKEQAAQIQKVDAQIQINRPPLKTALSNP